MRPSDISTDSKPPVGKMGVGELIAGVMTNWSTKRTGVLNWLMTSVAVLRGVGVIVRVGVRVTVGVFGAVGLSVGALVGAKVG